jgi:2-polyprenyl-6-methoxyphenol hydroxylase-like FAD-dependent oxidoreductase
MLGQEDHQAVLRDILSKDYNCTVALSTELVSFEQYPDHVAVRTRDVNTGVEQDARFDWLVGTDGAHSVVRKGLGLTFLGETVEANTLVIGDIEVLDGPDMKVRSFFICLGVVLISRH